MSHIRSIIVTIALIIALSFAGVTSAHAALLPVSRYHQAPTIQHRLPVRQYKHQ